VPLSTWVYKWGNSKFYAGDNLAMDLGVEKLLVASCYKNWDMFQPDEFTDFHTFAKYFSKYTTLLQYPLFFTKVPKKINFCRALMSKTTTPPII